MDTACPFPDGYLEVSRFAFNGFKIRIGDEFDIQMPADLDQFGRYDSHGTVICGKGLVQLGHGPSNGRTFLQQIDVISGIGQV